MSNSHLPIVRPEVFILEGLWSDTADAVRAAGGNPTEGSPWDINDTERELLSGNYHALILTGGSDINPRLYTDQPIHPTVYGVDYIRDEVEIRALEIALELGMPVLGICRGSQIMTAFRGGRLCQNIEGHRGTEHRAYAAPDARTFRRAIGSREMRVVSLHHQCVVDPGPGMRIAALAHDGTPEAVESIDGRWLGCQFHPEINTFSNANSYHIFCWLVRGAAAFAGGRAMQSPFRLVRGRQSLYSRKFDYGTGWDDQAWGNSTSVGHIDSDAVEITERNVIPFDRSRQKQITAGKAVPQKQPRKAGEPSLPSMRVTAKTGARPHDHELLICPLCAVIFDRLDDLDDHKWYIHGYERLPFSLDDYVVEPPEGDDAWEPSARDRDLLDAEIVQGRRVG
jgi:putative glutamine amidotransferase